MDKLLKVTMEFDTYTQTLQGSAARKWLDSVNSMCTMNHIHGNSFPSYKWKKTPKRKQLEFDFMRG